MHVYIGFVTFFLCAVYNVYAASSAVTRGLQVPTPVTARPVFVIYAASSAVTRGLQVPTSVTARPVFVIYAASSAVTRGLQVPTSVTARPVFVIYAASSAVTRGLQVSTSVTARPVFVIYAASSAVMRGLQVPTSVTARPVFVKQKVSDSQRYFARANDGSLHDGGFGKLSVSKTVILGRFCENWQNSLPWAVLRYESDEMLICMTSDASHKRVNWLLRLI